MNNMSFSINALNMLKSIKGKNLISYESDTPRVSYSRIKINTDGRCLVLSNEQKYEIKNSSLFDDGEEVSVFDCYETVDRFDSAIEGIVPIETTVSELIQKVLIKRYTINVSGQYACDMDIALIIVTDNHKYVFSRNAWFSEEIFIGIDTDIDYSCEACALDLSNSGVLDISVISHDIDL